METEVREERRYCTAMSYMAEGTTSQGMWTISRSRQESQGKTKHNKITQHNKNTSSPQRTPQGSPERNTTLPTPGF